MKLKSELERLAEAVRKAEAELDAATTPVAQPHGGEAVVPIVRLDNCAGFIRKRVQLPELYRARFSKLPREIVVKV